MMVLEPTGRVDVGMVAFTPSGFTVPNVVVLAVNVTVPVGCSPVEDVTVVVKVTVWPCVDGLDEDVSAGDLEHEA